MENILLELEQWKNKYDLSEIKRKELESQTAELQKKTEELQALVKLYEERWRLSTEKKYGASSEKTDASRQLLLFDEVENEADTRKPEPTVEEITYIPRKKAGKREDDLSGLPVETVEHSLPEGERACPKCQEQMHVMGHETRRELEIIPAQVRVIEHRSETYACRRCDKEETSATIIKAPSPAPVIKGSLASASSVAHIMVQKYMNAMPLYRQEIEFLLNGMTLSRQTMANWLLRCSDDWLSPLYELMRARLLQEEVLHADETVLQVLKEPGRSSRNQSYMWLYRTSGCCDTPVVLYEYQPTRSSSHPKTFLKGYKGYLHTDGYSGYHNLAPDICVVGCFAHVRRKFDEAIKSSPPEERDGLPAHKGLELCNKLFALEREYEKLNTQERFKERTIRSKPIFDEFFTWVTAVNTLPKSALGKAIHYALGQKQYLERIFIDGRLELSNNRAERSIKPFVMGRKNWLFCCTPKGARASSVIYSIVETAKENNLKPFEYLEHVFKTMPNIPQEAYSSLLPWSDTLPESCKQNNKTP